MTTKIEYNDLSDEIKSFLSGMGGLRGQLGLQGLAVAMVSMAYPQSQERPLQSVDTVVAVVVLVTHLPGRQVKYGWISSLDIKGQGLSLQRAGGR